MTGVRLVGLAGRKRSGKSTVADRLCRAHGWVEVALADPLKVALLDVDPLLPSGMRVRELVGRVGWEEAKDEHPEVRRLLQALGGAVRDHVDEDVWIAIGLDRAERALAAGYPVVASGVRYPNEAAAVRAAGGVVCWVDRPGLPNDGDRHPSETSLTRHDCDLTVVNRGSLDDLWRVADNLAGLLARYDLAG